MVLYDHSSTRAVGDILANFRRVKSLTVLGLPWLTHRDKQHAQRQLQRQRHISLWQHDGRNMLIKWGPYDLFGCWLLAGERASITVVRLTFIMLLLVATLDVTGFVLGLTDAQVALKLWHLLVEVAFKSCTAWHTLVHASRVIIDAVAHTCEDCIPIATSLQHDVAHHCKGCIKVVEHDLAHHCRGDIQFLGRSLAHHRRGCIDVVERTLAHRYKGCMEVVLHTLPHLCMGCIDVVEHIVAHTWLIRHT